MGKFLVFYVYGRRKKFFQCTKGQGITLMRAVFLAWLSVAAGISPQAVLAQAPEQLLEGALSGAFERAIYYQIRGLKTDFSNNWGNTVRAAVGTTTERYRINGPFNTWTWGYRPAVQYADRNHGEWTKGWVAVENAADTLDVKLRNFSKTPGVMEVRFQIYATCMFRGQVEFRQYSHGASTAQLTTNGRARGHITLNMKIYLFDNATRVGWQVESADMKYSDVVVDRVGHIGGYAARVIGDAFTGGVNQWFSENKREAIDKAQSSISESLSGSIELRSQVANIIRPLRP